MDKMKVLATIKSIQDSNLSITEKEDALHELERKNKNELFIKTDYCPHCERLNVDIWFKHLRFTLK